MTRKFGEPFIEEDNEKCIRIGQEAYKKLAVDCDFSPDLILNTLCFQINCLMKLAVDKDDRPVIIQLVHKILTKNND